MFFINRLTQKQVEELLEIESEKIMQNFNEAAIDKEGFCIDEDMDELEGQFYLWINLTTIHCIFSTFGVDLIVSESSDVSNKNINLLKCEMEKTFLKFMYSVFGEEYKDSYLTHMTKVFE